MGRAASLSVTTPAPYDPYAGSSNQQHGAGPSSYGPGVSPSSSARYPSYEQYPVMQPDLSSTQGTAD